MLGDGEVADDLLAAGDRDPHLAARLRGPLRLPRRARRALRSAALSAAASRQEGVHLRVGGLVEVLVPVADRPHHSGVSRQTTSSHSGASVSIVSGAPTGTASTSRSGSAGAQRPKRGAGGAAGREAVVDEDHRPSGDIERGALAAVAPQPLLQLVLGALRRALDLLRAELERAQREVVEDADAALGDRAHAELRVPGRADLPHDEHIEWRTQRSGDLEGDRHAATREADHDGMLGGERLQPRAELAAGVAAVVEHSRRHQ